MAKWSQTLISDEILSNLKLKASFSFIAIFNMILSKQIMIEVMCGCVILNIHN